MNSSEDNKTEETMDISEEKSIDSTTGNNDAVETIMVSEEIKKNLPNDFDINDIGSINLKEAEEIAEEKALVISEKELLEGIDDLHLEDHDNDYDQSLQTKDDESEKIDDITEDKRIDDESEPVDESANLPASDIQAESIHDTAVEAEKQDITTAEIEDTASSDLAGGENLTEQDEIVEKESLSDDLKAISQSEPGVLFIDDETIEKDITEKESIFDDNELGKVVADIVEVEEGRGRVLYESDIEEDREKIAGFMGSFSSEYRDLLSEFDEEYKFIDDELDLIHSAIVEEEYKNYIREIDEFYQIKGKKKTTTAVELIGLTGEELIFFEKQLFLEEYNDVNLYEIFDFFENGSDKDNKKPGEKNYIYILPGPESLTDTEKLSIEEDISSSSALIFEENVDHIKELLRRADKGKEAKSVEIAETYYDITDRVVIIEDEDDIDRFIKGFPEEKQYDIKRLLKYLDGLFEKLPEGILKNFADSEYFDLYAKVLNELGV